MAFGLVVRRMRFCRAAPGRHSKLIPQDAGEPSGFDPKLFEILVKYEDSSFWFVNRARLIIALIRRYFPRSRRASSRSAVAPATCCLHFDKASHRPRSLAATSTCAD